RRGAVLRAAGLGLALEHFVLDPVDRLVQDSAQVAQCVLADRLGVPGRGAQFAAELLGQPFQVTIGVRVAPAMLAGRARPAAPAGPAGPLAPLPLTPAAAGPVVGLLVPASARAVPAGAVVPGAVCGAGTSLLLLARRVFGGRPSRPRGTVGLFRG